MKAGEIKHKKGLWTVEEDKVLLEHIRVHGIGQWNRIPKLTGLKRCGKSCRLRWLNYLSPNVKRGCFSEEEEDLIMRLHKLLGNRWSLIAGRMPGRTDNQVKNHWNTHLSKKLGLKSQYSRSSKVHHVKYSCKLPKKNPTTTTSINSDVNNYNNQLSNYENITISGGAKSMQEVMQDQNKSYLDRGNVADEEYDRASSSEKPQESPCNDKMDGPDQLRPLMICNDLSDQLRPLMICNDLSDIILSNRGFVEFLDWYPDVDVDHQTWQSL